MFCPNCGVEVKDDAKFCENCGASLDDSREDIKEQDTSAKDTAPEEAQQGEDSMVCPNCGAKIDKDSLFCENCGERIYQPQESVSAREDDLQEEDEEDTEKPGFFHTTAGQVLIGVIAGCAVLAIIIGIYNFSRPNEEVVVEEPVESKTEEAVNPEDEGEKEAGEDEEEFSIELPEDVSIQPAEDADYLVPDADTRYYTESELSDLDKDQLRLARNEIYARHGRKFKDPELQAYFDGMDWYNGTIAPGDFDDDAELNKYEKANIDLIKSLE